jgi:hypothetical protein
LRPYLVLGDPHGDLDFVERAAAIAAENDAEIICLGDWGFIWGRSNMLQALSTSLARAGEYLAKSPVIMRFIDGNHDDHVALAKFRKADEGWGGGIEIAPNVIYQPRGSQYTDSDGTRFLFCGGAPSIDYRHRREGYSWWEKEEIISEEEFSLALNAPGPFHVLVTHDTHTYPPGYGPKGTPWFQNRGSISMEMIAGLVEKHKPVVHFHGHWHTRYSSEKNGTKTYGLASNVNMFNDAVMLWSRDEI